MLSWCVARLVGLLYACGVRRLYDLWRVSLNLSLYSPFFLSLYLPFVLRLVCFALVVFWLSSCLVLFVLVSLWLLLLFPFPLRYIRKKKGRKGFAPCVLSSCVIDLVGVRFPVLVKFVIVSLNLFGDTFIGNCIFVIVSPLLEKAFENTIDEFPRVKLVLYALLYVI